MNTPQLEGNVGICQELPRKGIICEPDKSEYYYVVHILYTTKKEPRLYISFEAMGSGE